MAKASAYDIEVANADGVTIYYNYTNNGTELEVTYNDNNYSYKYSGNVVIPQSVTYNSTIYNVTSIGLCAFLHCTDLTEVSIPDGVTSINASAFSNCGIISINIPSSVSFIGKNAFNSCKSLVSITIPEGVTTILGDGFSNCYNLKYVSIPNSLTSMGNYVFVHCLELTTVVAMIQEPFNISSNTFSQSVYESAILHVPQGTVAKYKMADGWKYFVNIVDDIPADISNSVNIDDVDDVYVYKIGDTGITMKKDDLKSLPKGIYILRNSDGTVKKVLVK
ncbi:MAG: leucine-rich repeat domain-containing protein [Prevotellaceae bacterium]|nr:leucine-rich repeat domain-containing protein [Prevotellaceae bacterium]